MATLICGNCGFSNAAGERFCQSCDGFLDWSGQATEERPAEERRVEQRPVETLRQPIVDEAPAAEPRRGVPTEPAAPAAGPTLLAPPSVPVMTPPPDLRRCPACQADNDLGRRFCRRCGHWLVSPTQTAGLPARRSWWRRLLDRLELGRGSRGARSAYRRSLARSTTLFRLLAAVVVLALVAVLLGVAGLNPVRWGRDQVGHMLGSGRVEGIEAAAQPTESSVDSQPGWAVDNVRGRGWTTPWTAPTQGDPSRACSGAAPSGLGAGALVLNLPSPTDVREIGFEAGLSGDDKARLTQFRPRTLEVRWPSGTCRRVDLADDAGLQRVGVDEGKVTTVQVAVVAVYEPKANPAQRLTIGEVTLWHR